MLYIALVTRKVVTMDSILHCVISFDYTSCHRLCSLLYYSVYSALRYMWNKSTNHVLLIWMKNTSHSLHSMCFCLPSEVYIRRSPEVYPQWKAAVSCCIGIQWDMWPWYHWQPPQTNNKEEDWLPSPEEALIMYSNYPNIDGYHI